MAKFKRALSMLIAVVMAFSVCSVAFTASAEDVVPIVDRVISTGAPRILSFNVPQYISAYGTNYFLRGSNIKPEGMISFYPEVTVTDVTLTCSVPGLNFTANPTVDGVYKWTISGGTFTKVPVEGDSVKFTVSYRYNGKTYETSGWSAVKIVYNNVGYFIDQSYNYFWATYKTFNEHIEWVGPTYGVRYELSNAYLDPASFNCYEAPGVEEAVAYKWDGSHSEELENGYYPEGYFYIDRAVYSGDLSDTPLHLGAAAEAMFVWDGNHQMFTDYLRITSQQFKDANNNVIANAEGYSADNNDEKLSHGETDIRKFHGPIPEANTILNLVLKFKMRAEVSGAVVGEIVSKTNYSINIVTYDKTNLKALIDSESRANRQSSDFRKTAPTDGGDYTNFASWDTYYAALQNAWYIYGKENTNQAEIDNAINTLNACIPVYVDNEQTWSSGMMYDFADYLAIDTLLTAIPSDFISNKYSNGDNGLYYEWTKAEELINAIADTEYDRPLDRRYQGVVNTMKQNLASAISNINGKYKSFGLVFDANGTDVENLPAPVSYRLFKSMSEPAEPTKAYHRFTGWYYDKECTQPVVWPIAMNPNANYFIGNIQAKSDCCGVGVRLYAGWTVTGRTITFVSNGDTEIPNALGDEGEAYTGPTEVPAKKGWKFVSWCYDATLQDPVDWSTFKFGVSDITLYGKWKKDTFTVTFDSNGGNFSTTGTSYATFSSLYGDKVVEPEVPTKSDSGFLGWYYDEALSLKIDFDSFTVPSENITVYAKWNPGVRNVVLVTNDGQPDGCLSYIIGDIVYEPTHPTRQGFTFDKWYTDAELTKAASFPFTMSSDNQTLYAGWNAHQFDVYFSVESDASMASSFNAADYLQLDCGSVLVAPENPTRKGYIFKGWTYNESPYTFTTVPAHNITLVASWEAEPNTVTYTLRTDVDGSTVEQGDIITATMSIGANHYVGTHSFIVYYDSRYLKPALNGKLFTTPVTNATIASATANTAYFTLIDNPASVKVDGYNIWETAGNIVGRVNSFAPAVQYYPAEWRLNNTTLKDEYAHYEFVFFSAANSKSAVSGGNTIKPDPAQDICSFQFIVLDDAPLADGTTDYAQLLVPSAFTKENDVTYGKITAAYEDDSAFDTAAEYNSTYVINGGDIRFAVEEIKTATINFETNSESVINSITEKVGRTISLPTPEKSYHDFLGWTLTNDAADTNYVDADAFVVPANGATLYAKWEGRKAAYTVRHFKQNETATGWLEAYEEDVLSAVIGEVVTATPKNYEGFTCATSDSDYVVGDGSLVLNLYYTRNSSSITLNANGGTFVNGQTSIVLNGLYGATVNNVYGNPTRTGYKFEGWQYGAKAYTLTTYPEAPISVSAKWSTNAYTFTFYLNGVEYAKYTKNYGEAVYAPEVDLADSEVFSGWLYNGAEYDFTTMPAQDMDFYGTIGIEGYYVTLYINGVQYGAPIPVTDGTVTADMIAYTPEAGYTFSGWLSSNSVAAAPVAFPYELNSDVSFYGFSTRQIYTIDMYYYVDGALEYFDSVKGYYGDALNIPELPDYTEYGFEFNGWYTDEDLENYYAIPETMPAQNITLYGEWTTTVTTVYGNVDFDLNGGEGAVPADITGEVGTSITLPSSNGISKKFYKFAGWGTTPTSTVPVATHVFSTSETVTYYAIWEVNFATVEFNLNGATGTTPEAIKVVLGDTIAELPSQGDLNKDGFTFIGWAETADAKTAIESYTVTSVGTKTLYAIWEAVQVSVELVAGEDSTTVIDNERNFIYGLDVELTENDLNDMFLDVIGNGHLEYEYTSAIGTGTIVKLINDYTGEVDATYVIVIFGDINGDGIISATDNVMLKGELSGSDPLDADSAAFFAADLNGDGAVTATDVVSVKAILSGSETYDQAQER